MQSISRIGHAYKVDWIAGYVAIDIHNSNFRENKEYKQFVRYCKICYTAQDGAPYIRYGRQTWKLDE